MKALCLPLCSQGGHVALKAALTHTPPLAACVAMSTWLEPSRFEVGRGGFVQGWGRGCCIGAGRRA